MHGLNVVSDRREEIAATSAILLYAGRDGKIVYGTAHPVSARGNAKRAAIGAGRPIDRSALLSCLVDLSESNAQKAEFLPETVLGVSQNSITWWCRPAMRRVFFDCHEIGKRTALVPHPGLVFHAASSGFRVFALKDHSRPTLNSTLHEPPYFNTWDLGKICIGTAHVPKRIDVASIAGWESGFFDSAFTHPNVGGKRVNHSKGPFAFWKAMLDGKFAEQFPQRVLIPVETTLADLIGGNLERSI
jgi:PRTRC genetic system protein B